MDLWRYKRHVKLFNCNLIERIDWIVAGILCIFLCVAREKVYCWLLSLMPLIISLEMVIGNVPQQFPSNTIVIIQLIETWEKTRKLLEIWRKLFPYNSSFFRKLPEFSFAFPTSRHLANQTIQNDGIMKCF